MLKHKICGSRNKTQLDGIILELVFPGLFLFIYFFLIVLQIVVVFTDFLKPSLRNSYQSHSQKSKRDAREIERREIYKRDIESDVKNRQYAI